MKGNEATIRRYWEQLWSHRPSWSGSSIAMAAAGSGEILVSATVMDLLDGSRLNVDDAGIHELKGLHGARQLYRLAALERD